MCNWPEIIREYKLLDLTNSNIYNEFRIIEEFNNHNYSSEEDANWNTLSDNEKQIKRIFWSKMAKKTEGYDEGFFRLEESLIDFYEAINSSLIKFNYSSVKNEYTFRLTTFLYLEIANLNRYKDIRKVDGLYYLIFKSLIYDCLNSGLGIFFIENINILYLESKLDIAQKILKTKN